MPSTGQKCTQSGIYSGKCTSNGQHVNRLP